MSLHAIVKPTIFREYIDGSKSYPDNFHDFPDIIDPKIKEFHFIIAFAAEEYDESGKGTGKFYKNWIVRDFDGEKIHKLKKRYECGSVKVKVVVSIGGRGAKYPFNPAEKEIWFDNARDSLTTIINDLKDPCGNNVIDGIDINYDTIIVNPSDEEDVFASCMGRLITSLKNEDHLVHVVSIAPSLSVQSHYKALHSAHKSDIDWVNYQFYTHTISDKIEFKKTYRALAKDAYPRHNLLAGFSTDPSDAGKLPREVFIEACGDLVDNGDLPGIFFWDANDSALNEPPFQWEKKAQKLLTRH